MTCARGLGYCLYERDDEFGPTKGYQPDWYYKNKLKEIEQEDIKFMQPSLKEKKTMFQEDIAKRVEAQEQCIIETKKVKARLEEMLFKVKTKDFPPMHKCLQDFCVEQLTITLKHDGDVAYHEQQLNEILSLTYEKWEQDKKEQILRSRSYYTEEALKEKHRNEESEQWFKTLFELFN